MTDHAEHLNALLGDVLDEYDKSNGLVSKEDVLEALAWSMVAGVSHRKWRLFNRHHKRR